MFSWHLHNVILLVGLMTFKEESEYTYLTTGAG